MATLHHTKLTPLSWSATSAQDGFPASNTGNESLARPWKATATTAHEHVTELAAAHVQTVFFHDVNFATCDVYYSNNGVDFILVGAALSYPDEYGRRRGKITVNQPGVVAIKIAIANGASQDGLGHWRVGAVYLYGSSMVIPIGPSYGYRVRTKRPRVSVELANGQTAQARTGLNIDRIEFPYDRKFAQSLRVLHEKSSLGTVLVSMDIDDWPEQMWPVQNLGIEMEEDFYKVHKAKGAFTLTEVTG